MALFPRFQPSVGIEHTAKVAIVAKVQAPDCDDLGNVRNNRNFRSSGLGHVGNGQKQLSQRSKLSQSPPCPADVAERAAIIAESDGCDGQEGDRRALSDADYVSWRALAGAHAERILAELNRLPKSIDPRGQWLLDATQDFLFSGFWPQAIEAGWTFPEIFGVDPSAPIIRSELWGLVPRLAFSSPRYSRLTSITPEAAEFLTAQGSLLVEYRFSAGASSSRAALAIEWWRCASLFGERELLVG